MSSEVVVEIRDLHKNYGPLEVLKGIDLTVHRGEKVVALGPAGSGKSTMLRCINALEDADSGSIKVAGQEITDRKININKVREHLGMVFQRFNLWPHKPVIENVMLGQMVVSGKSSTEAKKRALETLERVGLADKADQYPVRLSGGQQQRVAIARAIVNEPEVLLLDEPLAALDLKMRKDMQMELKEMHKTLGITFIYVTHDQEEALTLSDTIVVMSEGKIQQIGTPVDIYNEPINSFVADFIGESNILNGTMIQDKLVRFAGVEFECVDEKKKKMCRRRLK